MDAKCVSTKVHEYAEPPVRRDIEMGTPTDDRRGSKKEHGDGASTYLARE